MSICFLQEKWECLITISDYQKMATDSIKRLCQFPYPLNLGLVKKRASTKRTVANMVPAEARVALAHLGLPSLTSGDTDTTMWEARASRPEDEDHKEREASTQVTCRCSCLAV